MINYQNAKSAQANSYLAFEWGHTLILGTRLQKKKKKETRWLNGSSQDLKVWLF